MKKYVWVMALLAALAMLFAGCGNSSLDQGDEEEEEETRGEPISGTEAWWVAPSQKGRDRKYPDNKVPVIGELDDNASYVHVFFQPPVFPANLPSDDQFMVEITLEFEGLYDGLGLDLMWQCGFDPYGTWARSSTNDDYIDYVSSHLEYILQCIPNRIFSGSNWDTTKSAQYPEKKKLTVREMTGLCIQIPTDADFNSGDIWVKDVKFYNTGLGGAITGPNPPIQ